MTKISKTWKNSVGSGGIPRLRECSADNVSDVETFDVTRLLSFCLATTRKWSYRRAGIHDKSNLKK